MKKINYLELDAVADIMGNILNTPKMQYGLKKTTLFQFWDKVVGKKFFEHTKIKDISNDILTVATDSAAVTAEMSMFKSDILKKFNTYSKPLGIVIRDINFSHKIWKKEIVNKLEDEVIDTNPYEPDLSGFDPANIQLEETEVSNIRKSVEKNEFATPEQRERMFNAIILNLKTQKYLETKN